MSLLEAIILGFVQGITEFLPVSSSGHLVLARDLLGMSEPSLTYDVFLHLSTLLAVIVFFWKDILAIRVKELSKIAVASIPAALAGVFLQDILESAFSYTLLVGCTLLVTALLMVAADAVLHKRAVAAESSSADKPVISSFESLSYGAAFRVGVFQAIALIPGISRSGSTVAGGIFNGLSREFAFRASFLMVIPVILGASALQFLKSLEAGLPDVYPTLFLAGGATAFFFGVLSLKLFKYVIQHSRLVVFGAYAGAVGLITIAISLFA